MKKYVITFQREFSVPLEAASLAEAQEVARRFIEQQAPAKLLSILPEGYVESSGPEKPTPPFRGKPNGGGSPGTPVVRTEVLVDQVAEAA